MSTPLRLVTATDTAEDFGPVDAIITPPVITPQIGEVINPPRAREPRLVTWQEASPAARRVLNHMRLCTPEGAASPWPARPSVSAIQRHLDDGCPEQDLLDLVEGAAILVARRIQSPKWWYPSNLFAGETCERWLADIAAFRLLAEKADKRSQELAALETRDADASKGPQVQDLRLRRLCDEMMASLPDAARLSPAKSTPA